MEHDEIEKMLARLRADVHAELTKLDEVANTARVIAHVLRIHADGARNVALEALSEIRYIKGVLAAANTEAESLREHEHR